MRCPDRSRVSHATARNPILAASRAPTQAVFRLSARVTIECFCTGFGRSLINARAWSTHARRAPSPCSRGESEQIGCAAITRHERHLRCDPTRSSGRYWNLADALRPFAAPLTRRPLGNGRVPPPHVGILLEIDGLPFVARDPRPDGDIGDGIVVGDEFALRQAAVEHTVQPPCFLEETFFSVGRLALVVFHEM